MGCSPHSLRMTAPFMVLDDFIIYLEKPYDTNFCSLITLFNLRWITTTSMYTQIWQSTGSYIYTRHCTSENVSVKQLHASDHFSIFSTLTSCLDEIYALSTRPMRTTPSNPLLSVVLCQHRSVLSAEKRLWRESKDQYYQY